MTGSGACRSGPTSGPAGRLPNFPRGSADCPVRWECRNAARNWRRRWKKVWKSTGQGQGSRVGDAEEEVVYIVWPEPLLVAGPARRSMMPWCCWAWKMLLAMPRHRIPAIPLKNSSGPLLTFCLSEGRGDGHQDGLAGRAQEARDRSGGEERKGLLCERQPVPPGAACYSGHRGAGSMRPVRIILFSGVVLGSCCLPCSRTAHGKSFRAYRHGP